ncbi:MAG: hypothetical protein ABEK36_02960 [Candidatus Aenigmatarchaeota archaeon]
MFEKKFKQYREFYSNLNTIMRLPAVKNVSQLNGRKLLIELK